MFKLSIKPVVALILLGTTSASFATYDDPSIYENRAFGFWSDDSWNLITDHDAIIEPGNGGQKFDTEYLYYKYDSASNNLSVGIQTGFDLEDGKRSGNGDIGYYAGDLALSFDGDVVLGDTRVEDNSYEYAVDFGLKTKDYYGNDVHSAMSGGSNGIDEQGLYAVGGWDNDIINAHNAASPFAMDWGTRLDGLSENYSGGGFSDGYNNSGPDYSYFRIVTFNLDTVVAEGESFTVDAHWTMSCGNDYINGGVDLTRDGSSTPVPEPSVVGLLVIGSMGLFASGLRRRKK